MKAMAESGNPNSVSDAGVGAIAARSAVLGAGLNVRINAGSLSDKVLAAEIIKETADIENRAVQFEKELLELVLSKMK